MSYVPHKPHSSFFPVWVFLCIFMFLLFTLSYLYLTVLIFRFMLTFTSHPSKLHSIGDGLPSSGCCTLNTNQGYLHLEDYLHMHAKVFDMLSTNRTGHFWSSGAMFCNLVLFQIQRRWKFLVAHIASPLHLLVQGGWAFDPLVIGAVTEGGFFICKNKYESCKN